MYGDSCTAIIVTPIVCDGAGKSRTIPTRTIPTPRHLPPGHFLPPDISHHKHFQLRIFPHWFFPSQTSLKVAKLGFCSKKLRNVLRRKETQFSNFGDFQFMRYGRFSSQNSYNLLSTLTRITNQKY